jgi:hypothetical protein
VPSLVDEVFKPVYQMLDVHRTPRIPARQTPG